MLPEVAKPGMRVVYRYDGRGLGKPGFNGFTGTVLRSYGTTIKIKFDNREQATQVWPPYDHWEGYGANYRNIYPLENSTHEVW